MASRSETPSDGLYGSVPTPNASHVDRGYGVNEATQSQHHNGITTGVADFATGNPNLTSPLSASLDAPGSVLVKDEVYPLHDSRSAGEGHVAETAISGTTGTTGAINRSASSASTAYNRDTTPSRSGTLKKKASISRKTSLKRSGSRKSMIAAGSIKGVDADTDDYNSALYTPIPVTGNPTEILANRFQAWRTLLKSLITYFREIQSSYDQRSKALVKVSNVIQNMQHPSVFITDGGLADASRVLSDYHKHSLAEANKSKDIEADVVSALSGLRSDLAQKIKEIKSLNGDFKNTVDKEKEGTRKAIIALADALDHVDHNDASKSDPFLVKLSVDRSIERQIDEENYLHRAYLNLEASGRELESIVVGEIQKAYNAVAGILKREGDDAYNTVEQLRTGPIAMPKDLEWTRFVENDPSFVDPRLPLRRIEDISYAGKHDPQATEIRAGMLERKSKYLKSYTPGWYVLSPTHLHEFKSADKIYSQPPVMSLYLPDQKLGSLSGPDAGSHKFMLKGRQSGGMHRGHSWVFRAESHDTMLAWYEAIKVLTEKTGEERNAFIYSHARTTSANEHRTSVSSDGFDGLEEDEADQVPYSATSSVASQPAGETLKPTRPLPGGRFPSDLNVNRERAISPSTESENDTIAAAANLPGGGAPFPVAQQQNNDQYEADPYRLEGVATHLAAAPIGAAAAAAAVHQIDEDHRAGDDKQVVADSRAPVSQYETNPVDNFNHQPAQTSAYPTFQSQPVQGTNFQQPVHQQQPFQTQTFAMPVQGDAPLNQAQTQSGLGPHDHPNHPIRQNTNYGEWLAPAAAGVGAGALGAAAYNKHEQNKDKDVAEEDALPAKSEDRLTNPTTGNVVPIPTTTNTIQHAGDRPTTADSTRALYDEPVSSEPIVTGVNALPTASMSAANAGAYNSNIGTSGDTTNTSALSATTTIPYRDGEDSELGGQERKGAHGTGKLFPAVIRHDTDMSVSQLHVPGEFPEGQGPGAFGRPGAPRTTTAGSFIPPSQWDLVRE